MPTPSDETVRGVKLVIRGQEMRGPTVAEVEVEIVGRKGLGHPDTICDAVMERISQALSKPYPRHT